MNTSLAEQTSDFLNETQAIPSAARPAKPTFLASIVAIAGGQLGCLVLAGIAEIFYARLLGPEQRGLISLCLMSVAFGSLVGSLGSEATIVVWSSRAQSRLSTWFPAVLLWVLGGCLLAGSLWSLLYWKWHPTFLKGLTPTLATLVLVTIPVTVIFSIVMSLVVGEERFRLHAVVAMVRQVTSLAAFLFCILFLGRGAVTASVGNLIGLSVSASIALLFLKHILRDAWKIKEARQSFLPTLIFGVRGQAGNLASFFSYRLDVFVVNYFLNASQVGLYALGVLISEALWQVPGIVSTALCPRTARTVGAGADRFTCMILRHVFLLTVVAGILVALVSPLIIPLIFGARFAPSVPVIWWILPGTIALSLAKVICADLSGRGLNIHAAISSYIGLLFTLVLDWFLIPRMGIQGAALASSIAYLAATIYLLVVVQRELKSSLKNLLVPTGEEFAAYRSLWQTIRARFWPQAGLASDGQAQ